MKKLIYYLCLFFYYMFARHLPGSETPYSIGSKHIRGIACKGIFKKMGKHVNIEHGAFFGSGREIEIGDYSGLGINCRVGGPLSIGRDVMMGPDVMIYTRNHGISRVDIPMRLQVAPRKPVVIGDDVWIAARVIILPGVNIGKGALLAAGAVITKDVPEYAIVGGNPANVIKYRNS